MSTEKGRKAEERAARHLSRRGYDILGRNIRLGRGELDIVARKDGILAFVEVKLRPNREDALLALHHDKCERLRSAASAWLAHNPDKVQLQCRFDLIILSPGVFSTRIEHLQDIIR